MWSFVMVKKVILKSTPLPVRKTYKLFIDGKFPRSESGRSFQLKTTQGEPQNISRGSRKDFRNAVTAARKQNGGWKGATPLMRGQILYRLAEVMESRSAELVARILETTKWSVTQSEAEVKNAIDKVIWFAGWADKWQAILGTVNPVAGPYFNFSYHEPTGVVVVIAPKNSPLVGLVSTVLSCVVSGNTTVVLAEENFSTVAITWSEMLATSDLPSGVINVLTGFRKELLEHIYLHMDVNAISHTDRHSDLDTEQLHKLLEPAVHNLKRIPKLSVIKDWSKFEAGPASIASFTEVKTVWHPSSLP
jgi:acyl-CoA reductase-like NAD-dependent aldehyde dehydrogenase